MSFAKQEKIGMSLTYFFQNWAKTIRRYGKIHRHLTHLYGRNLIIISQQVNINTCYIMYPVVYNFTWIYTLLYPGNVYWSVSPCVWMCAWGSVCIVRRMFERMYAVVSPMKLCGSVCVFFYNKLAMRKSSWPFKKNLLINTSYWRLIIKTFYLKIYSPPIWNILENHEFIKLRDLLSLYHNLCWPSYL